jgi:hypothetical protein
MKIINSWTSKAKQSDKYEIVIRLRKLTVLKLSWDTSNKSHVIMLFNFGISF